MPPRSSKRRPPRCSQEHGRPSARPSSDGARIACGTDAPAIPHGRNAKDLVALVDRGMTPLQAIRAATTVAAELIDVTDRGCLEKKASWPTSSPFRVTRLAISRSLSRSASL
jgi:hypothetical protein